MTFTPTHPHGHITRDGRKARVLATDLANEIYPIVAVTTDDQGEWADSYTSAGQVAQDGCSDGDLINAPAPVVKVERWMIERQRLGFDSLAAARYHANGEVITKRTYENDTLVSVEIEQP